MAPTELSRCVRRRARLAGIVQGVGFRPFVHGLANRLGVVGFVQNRDGELNIEVQGRPDVLAAFFEEIRRNPPPTASVAHIAVEEAPLGFETGFAITESECASSASVTVAPDVATCSRCLAEVENPSSRWFGYAFTSCCTCGPRFTIMTAAPYDRERTSMRGFELCRECQAEYADPGDRRFHAQTMGCAACGPQVALVDSRGERIDGADPIATAAESLRRGKIGAVKGVGGFHLCCDATSIAAVETLRQRKRRDEKPLAVMVAGLADAAALGEITPEEERWLVSAARPIVLLRRRPVSSLAPGVAPGASHIGVMLPYSGLHHLLLKTSGGGPLVVTSGNASDEATVFNDDEARTRLGSMADFFLTHDREIVSRCDDSVVRLAGALPVFIRRSRGYAPAPLLVPFSSPVPTLAVGGQMKATFTLGESSRAILSHHLGDLDTFETLTDWERAITHYEQIFQVSPALVVHDLHPGYASTRYAVNRAETASLRRMAVQHHHAHLASCLADNGVLGPAIGVCFDGTGYGLDGAVWGGEFLIGDCRAFERAAHLKYVPMPGGEKAIREPWRMAAAYLTDAGLSPEEWVRGIPQAQLRTITGMMKQRINAPLTSSAGRFFDAMAVLLGLRNTVSYEGQAAMQLEALALGASSETAYDFAVIDAQPAVIDLGQIVRGVVEDLGRGADKSCIAHRIHATLALLIETVCRRLAERTGLKTVALSGGVFMNAILLEQTHNRLVKAGFHVLTHTRVPSNDGGLSLGQLAVAAAQTR